MGLRSSAVRVRLVVIRYESGTRSTNTALSAASFVGASLLFVLVSLVAF